MFKSFAIDQSIRVVISILYRVVLITYAGIILKVSDNKLPGYYYAIGLILYCFAFSILYKKDGIKAKARLVNDYLLIFLVLYGKPLDLFTYPLILLPLINSPNHSGNRRNASVYLLCGVTLYILSFDEFRLLYLIPLVSFLIVDTFEMLRSRIIRFNYYLYQTIEHFQSKSLQINKSHYLYKEIISKLNLSKFVYLFEVDSICCFKHRGRKLNVINGSFFIWHHKVKFENIEIEKLKAGVILENLIITINDTTYTNNYVLGVTLNDELLIYVINVKSRSLLSAFGTVYTDIYLKPLFQRITDVLNTEIDIRKERDLQVQKIKDKMVYVNNATLAMHFMKNKFSPIKGYFETLDLIEQTEDVEKRKVLEGLALQIKNKVGYSISEILNKADQILKKSENPFLVSEFKEVSLRNLFYITSKCWNYYFDDTSVNVEWSITEDVEQYNFLLNEEFFDIMVTDWVKNMHTYNKDYVELNFIESEDYFCIEFHNDFKETNITIEEIKKVINDFNSEDNLEISKRTSHGLSMIKSFLNQMRILFELSLENDSYVKFKLLFKK